MLASVPLKVGRPASARSAQFRERCTQMAVRGAHLTLFRRCHRRFGTRRVAVQVQQARASQNIHLPLMKGFGGKQQVDADGAAMSPHQHGDEAPYPVGTHGPPAHTGLGAGDLRRNGGP